jgi:hypothetical protein
MGRRFALLSKDTHNGDAAAAREWNFDSHGNLRGEKRVAGREIERDPARPTWGVSGGSVCSRKGKIVTLNVVWCSPFGKT